MADCDCLAGCPFFNDQMKDMQGTAALLKKKYCLDEYATCARHMVKDALGKPAVPADLYPHMQDRARQILAAAER
jgi:hypothetical protein